MYKNSRYFTDYLLSTKMNYNTLLSLNFKNSTIEM